MENIFTFGHQMQISHTLTNDSFFFLNKPMTERAKKSINRICK